MNNMRAIRGRIKSITNTQQITKAMKMVAASKLRKVQGTMNTMRLFDADNQKILDHLLESGANEGSALLEVREEVKKVAYVVFVGNRGLCGTYNSSVVRFLSDILSKETRPYEIIICGRWGSEIFKRFNAPSAKSFDDLSDTPNQEEAVLVSEYLINAFLNGDYDEIHLVYQKYVSALKQTPYDFKFLPLTLPEKSEDESSEGVGVEILFLPDPKTVLDKFLKIYTTNKLYLTMIEARVGEHTSRVNAMNSASDSTEKLIAKLQQFYNMARQTAITNEISEIVGGASALKKKES